MSVALQKPMTLEEFLVWEERQELRYEYDGSRPEAMTGDTLRHEAIGTTLRALLYARLRGSVCRPWGPNSKIEVQGRIRYPDAVVSCTRGRADDTVIPAPVIVFEILSPTTSRTDRIEKLREYQATASIQRYVILEQDSVAAMVFSRHDAEWTGHALTEVDVLGLPEIGTELPLADIYADADFGADPAA
jgi:Uma2 family endonuclease